MVDIKKQLNEWEELIETLSEKEKTHCEMKNELEDKKNEIIMNTDFKDLYGKNNEDVRKMHIKNILGKEEKEIKDLEFEISYIKRRIGFLKGFVRFYSKE